MDLETLREEIRKKDSMIIELIAERTALAEEIAKVKIETNEPLRNLEVEKKVITRYIDEGVSKGLSADTMKTVASALITEAVESESRLKIVETYPRSEMRTDSILQMTIYKM